PRGQNALQFTRAKTRHWPGKVSCLHAADSIDAVICRSQGHEGNARPPGPLPALEPESEYDVDIYTIIFLALAVFIFLRLRSVLGQRTGSERPPYDRAAPNVVQRTLDNNVVPMPGAVIDQAPLAPSADVAPADRWKGLAEPGTPLAAGLDAIAAQDSSFDPRHF